jgi:hypothetical protein
MAAVDNGRTTPKHLWIVGLLSLLWSLFGAFDYVKTRFRDTDYLKEAMPTVDPQAALAWVESMPLYAQAGWGVGVWFAVVGAVLLLMRSRHAVWAYGFSLVGAIISLGYQLLLAKPLPGAEAPIYTIMPLVIIAVALALFLYARHMAAKGVLR